MFNFTSARCRGRRRADECRGRVHDQASTLPRHVAEGDVAGAAPKAAAPQALQLYLGTLPRETAARYPLLRGWIAASTLPRHVAEGDGSSRPTTARRTRCFNFTSARCRGRRHVLDDADKPLVVLQLYLGTLPRETSLGDSERTSRIVLQLYLGTLPRETMIIASAYRDPIQLQLYLGTLPRETLLVLQGLEVVGVASTLPRHVAEGDRLFARHCSGTENSRGFESLTHSLFRSARRSTFHRSTH